MKRMGSEPDKEGREPHKENLVEQQQEDLGDLQLEDLGDLQLEDLGDLQVRGLGKPTGLIRLRAI